MTQIDNDAKEKLTGQPDVNAGAPRPKHTSADDERRPTMDKPPRAARHDQPGFDLGTEAEESQARTGTLPGSEGYADAGRTTAGRQPDIAQGDGDIQHGTDPKR